MSKWFRWYEGTCEDGKFRVVARNAGVTVATVMGTWAMLLEDASNDEHRGSAVRGCDFYAAILDISEEDMSGILQAMVEVGLVTATAEEITIVKWKERQFETDATDGTNAIRQRRYRERRNALRNGSNGSVTARNGSVTDTVTTEQNANCENDSEINTHVTLLRNGRVTATKRPDTDTDTDKNIPRGPALVFETDWPQYYRETFWELFPKRVDKQAAFRKLDLLRKGGKLPWKTLVDGVTRYAESVRGVEPKYIKGAAAWLNAGKWDDEVTAKTKAPYDIRAHFV